MNEYVQACILQISYGKIAYITISRISNISQSTSQSENHEFSKVFISIN